MDDKEGDEVATMEEFSTSWDWFIIWQSDYEANGDHIAKAYLALAERLLTTTGIQKVWRDLF